jgi:diguanylate cyclase (GGDEF)-like protein
MYEKLTGLFNVDYFMRYVNRYDQYYKDVSFDAVFCDIRHFHSVNKQYGRQFGDLVLRTIGISMKKLTRKTGGIGCRKEGGTFLLYFPHQEDCKQLLEKFMENLFVDPDTAERITTRVGVFTDAQKEPDIEERFARAKNAAGNAEKQTGFESGKYTIVVSDGEA